MSSNIYYIQTNIICIAILVIIGLIMQGKRENSPASRRAFLFLLVTIGIICLSDIFAWLYNGRQGESAYFMLMLSNIIYDGAITLAGYVWLVYVRLRVEAIENYSRRFRLLFALPLIIMLLALFTTPATGFVFTLGESNEYFRGRGIVLHWIISWGYLFYAGFLVLLRMRKTDSLVERRQLRPLLWFIVPPAIAAVVQMFFYGVTTLQCGMTFAALIIAFTAMQQKVSTDALTELNNRNAFENFVNDRILRQDNRFVLLMCDVDRFKAINDTLGHVVGDIVLKRMANVLKTVCGESRHRLFLCRYGGDEFIICSTNAPPEEVERIKASVAVKIRALNEEYPSEILLGMSIGYAEGICMNGRDVEALITQADEQMYEEKHSKGAER